MAQMLSADRVVNNCAFGTIFFPQVINVNSDLNTRLTEGKTTAFETGLSFFMLTLKAES